MCRRETDKNKRKAFPGLSNTKKRGKQTGCHDETSKKKRYKTNDVSQKETPHPFPSAGGRGFARKEEFPPEKNSGKRKKHSRREPTKARREKNGPGEENFPSTTLSEGKAEKRDLETRQGGVYVKGGRGRGPHVCKTSV